MFKRVGVLKKIKITFRLKKMETSASCDLVKLHCLKFDLIALIQFKFDRNDSKLKTAPSKLRVTTL